MNVIGPFEAERHDDKATYFIAVGSFANFWVTLRPQENDMTLELIG